ncbi:RHS repeat domain-containing protein [Halodesulfovibrio marinisediminis]|uniref:RHS repeat-associated core domain-containing protein n=1 Tax=Halodesulfovibrio marinisediminis DSM 17456 TaxID=1121457 RepID=A0A1N6FQE1_9BACT|nr:RHS repeat-associated core domain-containing protein [Halodesulfovibrio marinisediminis]SIN97477.1 RHS repeat-associated core domain-containing protein [Halodesulfovibrio marinisediminis DSM 17456]
MRKVSAMSTEEWLRRDVMKSVTDHINNVPRNSSRNQSMSTEEYLRNDVFGQSAKHSAIERGGAIAQRGADDVKDITPSTALKFQQEQFITKTGYTFGRMELHRNQEGQVVSRSTTFEDKTIIVEYSYDQKGRLNNVMQDGLCTERYRYGSRGERLQELNGTRYVYNHSSQLEQLISPRERIYFSYDERGNLIEKRSGAGITTYCYNSSNLLKEVCLPDGRCIQYGYDPLGRRAIKLVNGAISEKYCWKDMLRMEAACTGEDKEHIVFKYSEKDTEELHPTSLMCNGKEYFLAYDHVGTLLAVADELGRVLHVEETDSFGRRLSQHKLAHVAMLSFGGGLLDADTGLVHFLFRDYDPSTGRFIQQDPLGLRGGDADVYGYCLDDPVNLIDPIGLFGLTNDERKMINGKTRGWAHIMKQLATLLTSLPDRASVFADVLKNVLPSKDERDERDNPKDEVHNESYERRGEYKEHRGVPEESYPKLSLL